MALSRTAIIAEGTGQHAQVLTLAGLTSADDFANMAPVANATLRALGVAEAILPAGQAATGDETKALAYFAYFLLDRAVNALARKMDVEGTGAKAKLSQQVANLERQRDRALAVAITHGLPDYTRRSVVAPVSAGGLGDEPFFARASYVIPGVSR